MTKAKFILVSICLLSITGGTLAVSASKYSNQGLYFCTMLGGLPVTYSTGYKTTIVTAGFNTFATTTVFGQCPATKVTIGA